MRRGGCGRIEGGKALFDPMGAIHGKTGFDTFSKQLPVFHQSRLAATDLLRPPYKGFVDRLVRFLSR